MDKADGRRTKRRERERRVEGQSKRRLRQAPSLAETRGSTGMEIVACGYEVNTLDVSAAWQRLFYSLRRQGEDVDYIGTAGEVDFNEYGDVVTPVEVWCYEGGTIVSQGQ